MQRFLIRYSYFGTNFRGLQVQSRERYDYQTVQGLLEAGLRFLQPANEPVTHCASRTDAGVHALENALHVDLIRNYDTFEPGYITRQLNAFFEKADVEIRVHNTQVVSSAFNARYHACRRHYLYRLAVPKNLNACVTSDSYCPLSEINRLHVVSGPLDVAALRHGCLLLQREADFRAFMKFGRDIDPEISTVRSLDKVELSPGRPLLVPLLDYTAHQELEYYNISFSSRGFLRNQVRRCVAVLLGLSLGVVTPQHVENMFAEPYAASWPTSVRLAPAHGLYLTKVEYPDEVLRPDFQEASPAAQQWAALQAKVKTLVVRRSAAGLEDEFRPPAPLVTLGEKLQRLEELAKKCREEAKAEETEDEDVEDTARDEVTEGDEQRDVRGDVCGSGEQSVTMNRQERFLAKSMVNSKTAKLLQFCNESEKLSFQTEQLCDETAELCSALSSLDFSTESNVSLTEKCSSMSELISRTLEKISITSDHLSSALETPNSVSGPNTASEQHLSLPCPLRLSGPLRRRALECIYALLLTRRRLDSAAEVLLGVLRRASPMRDVKEDDGFTDEDMMELAKEIRAAREGEAVLSVCKALAKMRRFKKGMESETDRRKPSSNPSTPAAGSDDGEAAKFRGSL